MEGVTVKRERRCYTVVTGETAAGKGFCLLLIHRSTARISFSHGTVVRRKRKEDRSMVSVSSSRFWTFFKRFLPSRNWRRETTDNLRSVFQERIMPDRLKGKGKESLSCCSINPAVKSQRNNIRTHSSTNIAMPFHKEDRPLAWRW